MSEHPGRTSGTESRPGRDLDASLLRFDLREELRRLGDEPVGNDPRRATITLAKAGSFRVVLVNLARGTDIGGDETNGSLTVHVIRGAVTISRDDREERLEPEQLALVERGGRWRAVAESDAALLLTAAWPEEPAGESTPGV